jgi:Flp pilus assembly protein TadD
VVTTSYRGDGHKHSLVEIFFLLQPYLIISVFLWTIGLLFWEWGCKSGKKYTETTTPSRGMLLERGMLLFNQGRFDEAVQSFLACVELDPDDHEVRFILGRAYLSLGRFAEAVETFRLVVEKAPDQAEARYFLGVALNADEPV